MYRAEHQRHVAPVVALVGIELVDGQQFDHRHPERCETGQLGDEAGEGACLGPGSTFRRPAHVELRDDQRPSGRGDRTDGPATAAPRRVVRCRGSDRRPGRAASRAWSGSEVDCRGLSGRRACGPRRRRSVRSDAIGHVAGPGTADGRERPTLLTRRRTRRTSPASGASTRIRIAPSCQVRRVWRSR